MHLGVAEQTLAIWQTTGRYKLPMVKVGRLAKYRLTDLEKFLKKRTIGEVDQESTSAAPNTVKDSPGRNMPVRFRETNHHTLQSSVKQESGDNPFVPLTIVTGSPTASDKKPVLNVDGGLTLITPSGYRISISCSDDMLLLEQLLNILEKVKC